METFFTNFLPNHTMRPEDQRYHETILSQVAPGRSPFLNTAHVIEEWREDLAQLLAFGRVTPEEYEDLDARYAEIAKAYPIEQDGGLRVDIVDEPPQGRIVATYSMADMFPPQAA